MYLKCLDWLDFSDDWSTKTCVSGRSSQLIRIFMIIPLSQGTTTAALRKIIKSVYIRG